MTFAFLLHPRTDVRSDLAGVWRPLGAVPNPVYERALRMPLRPYRMATVRVPASGAPRPLGHLILVPRTPAQLLSQEQGAAAATHARLTAAVDMAAGLGARIVGLGGLTAPAAHGGRALAGRADLGITNGNAFTAHATVEAVLRLLPCAPRGGTVVPGAVALVGATGSVGSAVARELVRRGVTTRLLLVARTRARLEALRDELADRATVHMSTDVASVRRAGLVVLLTSAPDAILGPDHLAPGAVVLDDTQPRNTSPDLATRRPDVRVVDGGIVEAPGLRLHGGSIGLRPGLLYACLAETALLALAGHHGDFSVGHPTSDQVAHVAGLAQRFSHLGFHLAPPRSFGRPLVIDGERLAVAA